MKVLKNNVFIDVTCPHCKSELRVFENDIDAHPVFGHGPSIKVTCAACGKQISLTPEQLRPEWKHLIEPDDDD